MAMFIGIAAAAVAGAGAYTSSKVQQAQYQAFAQANRYNAAVARSRAESVQSAFGQREEQQRRAARLAAGERHAAIAQSGTGLGGSNADIDRQSEVFAELDALNIRYEGALEAHSLRQQAGLEDFQAGINDTNATVARRTRFLNTASAALSAGAGAYGMSGGFKTASAPSVGGGTTYGMYGSYRPAA